MWYLPSFPKSEFTDILKSAMEGEFTPWKLANATNQDLFSQIVGCYILPAYHWLGSCSSRELIWVLHLVWKVALRSEIHQLWRKMWGKERFLRDWAVLTGTLCTARDTRYFPRVCRGHSHPPSNSWRKKAHVMWLPGSWSVSNKHHSLLRKSSELHIQAFLDFAGCSQACGHSHILQSRGGWLTWTWAWRSRAVFRIPSSALITAGFRPPFPHSRRSACSARAIIMLINSNT